MTGPIRAAEFVDLLAARGRYHFTTEEGVAELGGGLRNARDALRRLKEKGLIADPYRGFHVVVPPEYRRLGCLPAEQFIPQLMAHLGLAYYVGLLSAAELHGAAHQRPQALQVILEANRRALQCGEVRVQFVARKGMGKTPTVEMKTPRGPFLVSSPEATALELVGYADQCGGLDNVASVLVELAEALDKKRLLAEATGSPIAWAQRLGYLLDLVGKQALSDKLAGHVRRNAKAEALLVRSQSAAGAPRDERWRLAVNATVEADL